MQWGPGIIWARRWSMNLQFCRFRMIILSSAAVPAPSGCHFGRKARVVNRCMQVLCQTGFETGRDEEKGAEEGCKWPAGAPAAAGGAWAAEEGVPGSRTIVER